MPAQIVSMTDDPIALAPPGAERVRATALGVLAAVLAIAFVLLLAADEASVVTGMR